MMARYHDERRKAMVSSFLHEVEVLLVLRGQLVYVRLNPRRCRAMHHLFQCTFVVRELFGCSGAQYYHNQT